MNSFQSISLGLFYIINHYQKWELGGIADPVTFEKSDFKPLSEGNELRILSPSYPL